MLQRAWPLALLVAMWLEHDLPRQQDGIPAGLITARLKAGNCLVLFLRFLEVLVAEGKIEEANNRQPRGWPGQRYRAGTGNHPVAQVSWEDGCAFAAWLDAHLRAAGVLAAGEQLRLPTEPEWERAAAYPAGQAAARRDYVGSPGTELEFAL